MAILKAIYRFYFSWDQVAVETHPCRAGPCRVGSSQPQPSSASGSTLCGFSLSVDAALPSPPFTTVHTPAQSPSQPPTPSYTPPPPPTPLSYLCRGERTGLGSADESFFFYFFAESGSIYGKSTIKPHSISSGSSGDHPIITAYGPAPTLSPSHTVHLQLKHNKP